MDSAGLTGEIRHIAHVDTHMTLLIPAFTAGVGFAWRVVALGGNALKLCRNQPRILSMNITEMAQIFATVLAYSFLSDALSKWLKSL